MNFFNPEGPGNGEDLGQSSPGDCFHDLPLQGSGSQSPDPQRRRPYSQDPGVQSLRRQYPEGLTGDLPMVVRECLEGIG